MVTAELLDLFELADVLNLALDLLLLFEFSFSDSTSEAESPNLIQELYSLRIVSYSLS